MSSWVRLLLLLLPLLAARPARPARSAARLRLGRAEGDPLPPSLVDLVRNSPIASVDDLKLLLQQESNALEEEEDEHDVLPNHTHGRVARSLDAQLAQQAACKTRTEVMEVTRSMLDRRNANFMLWPNCVEVQRCSGCCNTRMLQCVPSVTSSRYLQVIKIQFINRKAQYDKAVISVDDHVSCRCQPPSSSSSSSSVTAPRASNPNLASPLQPPPSSHLPMTLPRTVHPSPPKTHTTKADLHRHDDLKHNQQPYRPEEPAARQWQQGSYTHLVHWTTKAHQVSAHMQPGAPPSIAGGLGPVSGRPSEARAEHSIMGSPQQVGHGSGYDGNREASGAHQHHHHHHLHQRPQQDGHGAAEDIELRTQYRLNAPQSDSASPPGTTAQMPESERSPTPPMSTNQKDSVTSQVRAAVTTHRQTEAETAGPKDGNQREESGSANSGDSAGAEPANQGTDKDSNATGGDRHSTEGTVQTELDQETALHPHHPQQRPKPSTLNAAPSTVAPPVSASDRRAPFRPASPRRRRKRRKRISKAAIRAMIM
ncbi:platelet-derived growth factor beta polypeptide a [Brachionichthys hirsutus]|uniref:platelet-derived growth factor beta polypeptide a n=1 Tax=Brachionichthys hirsutus TaxID=412623 RepID=UPI003604D401